MDEHTNTTADAFLPGVQPCDPYDPNCTYGFIDDTEAAVFQQIVGIVVPILFSLVVAIGLVGNLLVIIVVVRNPQMRNTTNVLIISLAISDLSFILLCVPFTATKYVVMYWPFGDVWCKVVQYMIHVCAYASVYTLVLMSLDRYLAVVHPIASMSIRTTRNSWVAITCLWIVNFVCNVPTIWFFDNREYVINMKHRKICTILYPENSESARIFYATFLGVGYVIPLTIVTVLYILMLNRLWHGMAPGGTISTESLRSKKRVTRMVVIVVIIFALCWLPIQIVFLLKYIVRVQANANGEYAILYFQIVGQCLAYMNSCANPILYAFLSDNFRKGFKRALCCGALGRSAQRSTYMDFERTDARTALTSSNNHMKHEKIQMNDHQL